MVQKLPAMERFSFLQDASNLILGSNEATGLAQKTPFYIANAFPKELLFFLSS